MNSIAVETVTLERMKLAALTYFSKELADEFALSPKVAISLFDNLYGEIAIRITQMVYGRTMEKVEARYPSDWWQAFKQRWFPGWAQRRWPIKETCITLEAKELYPKLSAPDHGPQLQLYRMESPGYSYKA